MTTHPSRRHQLAVACLLLTLVGAAQAQALFIARKAIGRIEQMAQSSPPSASASGTSYDVATVIVDVAPARVFDAVKRQLAQQPQVRVTRIDEARQSVEFSDGAQIGGIQVSALGDQLSQLLVSTAHSGAPATTASAIVARILDVCRELDVVCERSPR